MGTAVLNVRHGPGSDSFSNRSFPSGQYPKVSIGILVERAPNFGSQPTKEDEAALPAEEKVPQSQGKTLECNQEMGKKACMREYRTDPACAKDAAWVSTTSTSHANPSSSARFFINQNNLLQLEEDIHKRCEKNKKKNVTMQNVEVAHASAWENHAQDKEKPRENIEDVHTFNNESLRLKLWEALGAAPLQNKQIHSSQHLKEDTTVPPIEKMCEQQNANINRNKQNSDTIETDSDGPRNTMRRPVTRSLTRRKGMKRPVANLKFGTNSSRKQLSSTLQVPKEKDADDNVFSFHEKAGKMGGLGLPVNNRSSKVIRKRSNRNTCNVDSCRVSFTKEFAAEKASKSSENKQLPSVVCVGDDIFGAPYSSPNKVKVHIWHQSNANDEKMLQNSATGQKLNLNTPSPEKYMGSNERDSPSKTYTGSPKSMNGQPFSADKNMYEHIDSSSTFRYPQSIHSIQSPTLAVNITSASQKEMLNEQVHCSNTLKEKHSDSVTPSSSRLKFSDSDTGVGTSNHMRYSTDSSFEGMQHLKKNKSAEVHLSQSQRALNGDSSQADEVSNQGAGEDKCSSDAGTNMTTSISFPCSKRLRYLGTDEGKQFGEIPEQLSEDGLPRAIFQLAMVLEQFKAKIKSHKSKKSSQILSLVGDKIHLQLQDVESQIQADMGKFTSLTKAKRKRLESTFQEQQEKLKIIHEKFKQEVSHHLLECRATLEELEPFQMEIKTSAELQKASHRKLLMQVEEAMEAQLNDAERSIATIQKVARRKMDNLRHALREWLSEGIP